MKIMTKTLLIALLFSANTILAQTFISAVSQFQTSDDCEMTLLDGTVIKGKFGSAMINNEYLSSISLKDADGNKHKHKAEEVKELKIKMGFLAKMDAANEGSSSISEAFQTDYNEIINREYIIYRQALLPKKKDKYRLMQLVNPGFDSRIQVFDHPGGKESKGIGGITGGKEKSYLVVVDGQKSVTVKKGDYKKLFGDIYQDCPAFTEVVGDQKIKFWDMAAHVFAYDQLCSEENQ